MTAEVKRLYRLRRDLLRLRPAVVPSVEVCRKLEHGNLVAIDEEIQPCYGTCPITCEAYTREMDRDHPPVRDRNALRQCGATAGAAVAWRASERRASAAATASSIHIFR